jgi:hypothetical protein
MLPLACSFKGARIIDRKEAVNIEMGLKAMNWRTVADRVLLPFF